MEVDNRNVRRANEERLRKLHANLRPADLQVILPLPQPITVNDIQNTDDLRALVDNVDDPERAMHNTPKAPTTSQHSKVSEYNAPSKTPASAPGDMARAENGFKGATWDEESFRQYSEALFADDAASSATSPSAASAKDTVLPPNPTPGSRLSGMHKPFLD
jgi:hypothetical protein